LWLYNYRKDLIPPVPPALQLLFDQGHEVGRLAWQRFPGGRFIEEDHRHAVQAMESTRAALQAGACALYEPAAEFDGVLVRADILLRQESGAWDLVEVKSSTDVEEVYLHDVAVQRYVLEGAGLAIRKTFLMHLDNKYARRGSIDVGKLFALADVTQQASEALEDVPARVKVMHAVLAQREVPDVEIGPQCYAPYECEFVRFCWADVPDYSVFDLAGASMEKKTALWRQGVRTVQDIPGGFPLTKGQSLQAEAARSGRPLVDPGGIAELLEGLSYPLHFLDFETINPAIPPYDGLRPFQQLPFQASVRVRGSKGAALESLEYLGGGAEDPRPGLIEFLLGAIGPSGSVLAYNASFEGRCLKELGESSPRHARRLESIKERLWDLAGPFRKGLYVHPDFRGSWSIKAVLPALVPEMSYAGLAIRDGSQAQAAYARLMRGALGHEEAEQIRRDLKEYCGQDTLAMVKLLDRLG